MKLSIIILNFKNADTTLECLESLKKLKVPSGYDIETIVVDNASDGRLSSILEKQSFKVTLIEEKQNLGFTGGSNLGIKEAILNGSDFVMLLNNDTTVDDDLVSQMVKDINDSKIGGVVPKIYFSKGYEFHKDRYSSNQLGKVLWYAGGFMDWANLIGKNRGVDEVDEGQYDKEEETELATGCCFLIKTEVLKEVGIFDEKYFLYYEDADLTERIRRAGYKIIYKPKAVVWHKNADSSGSGSTLQDYYISRNRLLFGIKYAPLRTKTALVREGFKILITGRKWQRIGARDFFIGKFGKGSFRI